MLKIGIETFKDVLLTFGIIYFIGGFAQGNGMLFVIGTGMFTIKAVVGYLEEAWKR